MVHLLLDNIRSRQFHSFRSTFLVFNFLVFLAISVFTWFLFRLSRFGWVGSFKLLEEEMLGCNSFSSCCFEREWRLAFLGPRLVAYSIRKR
jgi:hypothetical protein